MLSSVQDALIVFFTVGSALLLVLLLDRFWSRELRRNHNDLIGWHLGALGTTYAVILGFMLYAVWTDYVAADLNADAEASAVRNLYQLAGGLPEQQGSELRRLCRTYADTVLAQDWPEMTAGLVPEASHPVNSAMWKVLIGVKTGTPAEMGATDHAVSELGVLAEHRRVRLLQSTARLPSVLWCVLIVGGVLTISSACMFGSSSRALHSIQVFSIAMLISLALVAIGDIDRPYQGAVHVSNYAFERAQAGMKE